MTGHILASIRDARSRRVDLNPGATSLAARMLRPLGTAPWQGRDRSRRPDEPAGPAPGARRSTSSPSLPAPSGEPRWTRTTIERLAACWTCGTC